MAARTCLLCGKPLSRIFSGTGEEFCSREHRNQYRLRRGMDRLLEANKVASVMRRRENPKQIPAEELRATGADLTRAFLAPLSSPLPPIVLRPPRMAGRAHMNTESAFRTPRAQTSGRAEARDHASPVPFPSSAPRGRRVGKLRMPAHVVPAGPARLGRGVRAPGERKHPVTRWRASGRPVIERLLSRGSLSVSGPMPNAQPVRSLTRLSRGRELRVSTGAAFRIPEWKLRRSEFSPAPIQGLTWPGVRKMTAAALPPQAAAKALSIETEIPETLIPKPPAADFERRFRWPEALDLKLKFRNAANEARASAVSFGSEESASKERP